MDVSPAQPLVGEAFAIDRTMMDTAKVHSAALNCLLMAQALGPPRALGNAIDARDVMGSPGVEPR